MAKNYKISPINSTKSKINVKDEPLYKLDFQEGTPIEVMGYNEDGEFVYGEFNSSSGVSIVDTTYTELRVLITENNLVEGTYYKIIDFQTIYDQPDFDSDGNIKATIETKTGNISPLILLAISNSSFSSRAYQTEWPQDKITYDPYWDGTEINNEPAKGRIIERIDSLNNRTDYDHRVILFKRYESIDGSGIFDSYKDTGFNSQDFYTFNNINSNNNYIGDYFIFKDQLYEPFGLPNNVFKSICEGNQIKTYSKNNTVDSDFVYNKIGHAFLNNDIKGVFIENTIGNNFSNNIINGFENNSIGELFEYNEVSDMTHVEIGNRFRENTIYGMSNTYVGNFCMYNEISWAEGCKIGDYFENNTITNAIYETTIENYFYNNLLYGLDACYIGAYSTNNIATTNRLFSVRTKSEFIGNFFNGYTFWLDIGDAFRDNVLGNFFGSNRIGDWFRNNTFGDNCYDNTFGNAVGSPSGPNVFGENFQNNKTGNNVFSNTFGFSVMNNEFGNYVQNNTIGNSANNNKIGNYFESNNVGNDFYQNQIGNYFKENVIGDSFGENRIAEWFSDNDIGDYFLFNNISNYFLYNTIGDMFGGSDKGDIPGNVVDNFFSGNVFANEVIGNKFGHYFLNNIFEGDYISDNNFGSFFQGTVVAKDSADFSGFSENIFTNDFSGTINFGFRKNRINGIKVRINNILPEFNSVIINVGQSSISSSGSYILDFSGSITSSIVYTAFGTTPFFTKEIIARLDGTPRLKYIDNSDTVVIASIIS
jgi:hypothetical protein